MAPSGSSPNPHDFHPHRSIAHPQRSGLTAAALALLIALPAAGLSEVAVADHKSERVEHRGEVRGHYSTAAIDNIEARQDRQHRRIAKGVDSGDLTRSEARDLKRHQRKIAEAKRRYTRDGRLSAREEDKLLAHLDKASRRIHKYRNNGRYRGQRHHYARSNFDTSSHYVPVPRPFHHAPRITLQLGFPGPRYRHRHRHKHGHGHRFRGHNGYRPFGHHRHHRRH